MEGIYIYYIYGGYIYIIIYMEGIYIYYYIYGGYIYIIIYTKYKYKY